MHSVYDASFSEIVVDALLLHDVVVDLSFLNMLDCIYKQYLYIISI